MRQQNHIALKPQLFTGGSSYELFAKQIVQERIIFLTFPQITSELKARLANPFSDKKVEFIDYPFGYPDIDDLTAFHCQFWENGANENTLLIGVGGGSVLDCAKILRFKPKNNHWLKKNIDKSFIQKGCEVLPLALIPTTSGTGSEVTSTATLWNKAQSKKHSFYGKSVYADYAIVSGEFSLGNTWISSRDTALDALSHALEALWNVNRSHESSEYAIIAARLISQNLPKLKNDLDNLNIRNHLSCGSLLAGLAMAKTQTALAHALSYDLTVKCNYSHGTAVAYWLPFLWNRLILSDDNEGKKLVKLALNKIGDKPQDLENWLHALGVASLPFAASSPTLTVQISAMMNSPRGKNFSSLSHKSTQFIK